MVETFALKWSDLDFDNNTVHVQRTLQWNRGGGYRFDKPKTKNSRRYVPLPAGLVEQLREHRVRQAESLFKIGVRSELIFTSETGGPLHWQNVVKRHFKKVLEAAGKLPVLLAPALLRHTPVERRLERQDYQCATWPQLSRLHARHLRRLPARHAEPSCRKPPETVLRLRLGATLIEGLIGG